MALSERANQWLQRINKIHIRYFWGSIYDQCDQSPIMGWASFGHQASCDGSSGHLLITRWAGRKSKQNEPPFCKLWVEVQITSTGKHLFLFPFQMEESFFLFNCELVADTCTQNSHSGCRHSQLLIPLQVSSFSVLILTLTTCCQNSHSVSTPRQQATVGLLVPIESS